MKGTVEATYQTSRVEGDNPLIAALPPQMSRKELYMALAREFALPEDYQAYSPQERQELSAKIKQIYIPMEYAADIYSALCYGLRTAYTGRTKVGITKRMNDIGKSVNGKHYMIVSDSPFIAESFAILGEPGSGKSTTIRHILSLFPTVIRHTEFQGSPFQALQIPCISIECPVNHSEKSVCYQILEKIDEVLGTSYMDEAMRVNFSVDMLIIKIAQLCMRFSIGAILIDEIQNILKTKTKNPTSGNSLIRFLVSLANKTGVCLVCIGTTAVSRFFNAEAHLARRTRGPRIPLLSNGATYRTLLEKMWENIAVINPLPLSKGIADEVYLHTGGCIGKIASLLHYAAVDAIFFGRERIDREDIRAVAKKYDISARRPSLEPANISLFERDSRTGQDAIREEMPLELETSPFVPPQKKSPRGRPKVKRDELDILVVYDSCQEYALSLAQKLEEMGLVYGKKEEL